MKKYTAEDIVMNLVCNGGDCRSKALEAIQAARKGNFCLLYTSPSPRD